MMTTSASSASALAEIIVDENPVNHAIGTNRPDYIEGYASGAKLVGNVLIGRGGSDYILSDVLADDRGADGFSMSRGDGGNDTIRTYVSAMGSAVAAGSGGSGNDDILLKAWALGDEPAEVSAYGGAGDDRIETLAFSDGAFIFAHGGDGRDVIRAEIPAEHGSDLGLLIADPVGHAWLFGGAGRDTLIAIGGEDNELTGGKGNDRNILSDGADTFIFAQASNQGADRIEGWDRAEDSLSLHGWDGTAEVTDNGTDVRAEFTNGSSITFAGVGDGTTDSLYDLVDDPGQIDWMA